MGFSNSQRVPIEVSDRGVKGVAGFLQDQTSPTLSVPFLQERAAVTLASNTTINSNIITLEPGHGTLEGEVLEIAETNSKKFMQAEVISIDGDAITLDQPVNQIYTVAGTTALRSTKDLMVNGSVTPQVFSILPLPDQAGDMVSIIIEMRSEAGKDMDFTTFGSAPQLTNGCVLRVNHGDGTYTNKFNFKSNSDFFEQGFEHEFSAAKVVGNTISGFTARITWGGANEYGVVIRVDGALGESLELVIQDDLREITIGNTRFHLTAQGHELQE